MKEGVPVDADCDTDVEQAGRERWLVLNDLRASRRSRVGVDHAGEKVLQQARIPFEVFRVGGEPEAGVPVPRSCQEVAFVEADGFRPHGLPACAAHGFETSKVLQCNALELGGASKSLRRAGLSCHAYNGEGGRERCKARQFVCCFFTIGRRDGFLWGLQEPERRCSLGGKRLNEPAIPSQYNLDAVGRSGDAQLPWRGWAHQLDELDRGGNQSVGRVLDNADGAEEIGVRALGYLDAAGRVRCHPLEKRS